MRAWLLVIAVLATFQPIVQVASTESTSSFKSLISLLCLINSAQLAHFQQSYSSPSTASSPLSSQPSSSSSELPSTSTQSSTTISSNAGLNSANKKSISNNNMSNTNRNSVENSESGSDKPIDRLTQEQIDKFEEAYLSVFGLQSSSKPINRSEIVKHEAIKRLLTYATDDERRESVNFPAPGLHTSSANIARSHIHKESKIDDRFLHHHRFRLHFNVSNIPKNEILKAAELTLSRKPITDGTKIQHKIHVYDIVRPGIKGKSDPIFLLIDTKSVRINDSGSISLDVMPAVDRWLRTPKENHGILIDVVTGKLNTPAAHRHLRLRRSIGEDSEKKWVHEQPLLITYTDDGRNKQRHIRDVSENRSRRAQKRRGNRESCQRHEHYVDFNDLGWGDWIIAPAGFHAYFCKGHCELPHSDHMNTTNHAVMQGHVNAIDSSRAPPPCCVPTELGPISLLYLEGQNKVVLKNYQDMVVIGCGCR